MDGTGDKTANKKDVNVYPGYGSCRQVLHGEEKFAAKKRSASKA